MNFKFSSTTKTHPLFKCSVFRIGLASGLSENSLGDEVNAKIKSMQRCDDLTSSERSFLRCLQNDYTKSVLSH